MRCRIWLCLGLAVGCSDSGSDPNGSGGAGGTAGTAASGGTAGTSGNGGDAGAAGKAGASGNGGNAGAAGMAGASGSGGNAGSAGMAGTGGSAGAAGMAGSGGNAGTAGMAGAAGTGGTGPITACQPPQEVDNCGCGPGFIGSSGRCIKVTTECGGKACPEGPHGSAICNGTACGLQCEAGWGDCDGLAYNGCETSLNSPTDCGACGMACTTGQVCDGGTCTTSCSFPTSDCSGSCLALLTDPSSCGYCGRVCDSHPNSTTTCSGGNCGFTCDPGTTQCGQACADLQTDALNCGACDAACPTTPGGLSKCSAGKCDIICADDLTKCGDTCVDTTWDNANCGGCGVACSGTCVAGACQQTFNPVVASVPGEVFDLAYKMGSLYWIAEVPGNGSTTNTTYTVSAMALSDQVVHDLATGLTRSVALVVDDTHVYIANQAGAAIYRVPIAGGALELVSVSPTPTSLAEAGDNIYFRSQFGTTVFSAPKAGGSAIEVFDTGLSNSSWSPVLADAWGVYAGQTVHPFADGCPEFKLNRCLSTRIAAIDRSEFYQTWDQACGSKSAVNRETFFEREAASHVIYDGSDNQTPGYRIKTEGGRLYEVFADWNLDDYTHLYTRYRCGNQSAARILDSQITPRHGAMAFDNDYFYYVHIRWSPGPGYEYHIYRAPR